MRLLQTQISSDTDTFGTQSLAMSPQRRSAARTSGSKSSSRLPDHTFSKPAPADNGASAGEMPAWAANKMRSLENYIRKLSLENKNWSKRFRVEAHSRALVFQLRQQIQNLSKELSTTKNILDLTRRQADAAKHEAAQERQRRQGTQGKLEELHAHNLRSSKTDDVGYKPQLDKLQKDHAILNMLYDQVRDELEEIHEELRKTQKELRVSQTSQKRRGGKHRSSGTKNDKKKAASGKGRGKKKGKKGKKLSKFKVKGEMDSDELHVVISKGRASLLKERPPAVPHPSDFIYSSHASRCNEQEDWSMNFRMHAKLQSIVPIPWRRFQSKPTDNHVRVPYLNERKAQSLIVEMYEAKIAFDRVQKRTRDQMAPGQQLSALINGDFVSLAQFCEDYLLGKYGSIADAEGFCHGLVDAVRKFGESNPRLHIFSRIMGLIDGEFYDPRMSSIFLRLLNFCTRDPGSPPLCSYGNVQQAAADVSGGDKSSNEELSDGTDTEAADDDAEEGSALPLKDMAPITPRHEATEVSVSDTGLIRCWVPLPLALASLDDIFPLTRIDYSFDRLTLDADVRKELLKGVRSLPSIQGVKDVQRRVDLDGLILVSLDAWQSQRERNILNIMTVFSRHSGCDEDSPLQFGSFCDVVTSMLPGAAITRSAQMWLYRQCLCTSDDHIDCTSKGGFAVVLSAHGIVPPKELLMSDEEKKKQQKKKRGR
eukprot:g2636.t1